jgi:hypothetical protein
MSIAGLCKVQQKNKNRAGLRILDIGGCARFTERGIKAIIFAGLFSHIRHSIHGNNIASGGCWK